MILKWKFLPYKFRLWWYFKFIEKGIKDNKILLSEIEFDIYNSDCIVSGEELDKYDINMIFAIATPFMSEFFEVVYGKGDDIKKFIFPSNQNINIINNIEDYYTEYLDAPDNIKNQIEEVFNIKIGIAELTRRIKEFAYDVSLEDCTRLGKHGPKETIGLMKEFKFRR